MQATTNAPVSTFRRKPAPLPIRYAMGAVMYGVMLPAARILQMLGRTERALASANVKRQRRLAKDKPFGSYVPTEHDVIVATYAKSGTNWMMQIAHQLAFHGLGEFDHIHNVVPWPDYPPPMGKYAIPLEVPSVWMASPEHKRVIKTHLDWELIPYTREARYIAVIRDPKDVFVSNYHFVKGFAGPLMPPLETWYRVYLAGNCPLGGSWAANAAGFWAQRHRPNVLVMSFKSMKRDLPGAVRQVADFMDVRVPDDVIREVCAKSSFDYMKRIDEKFRPGKMLPWGPESAMIRKGTQGGSSELLSPEQQREIDSRFMAELKQLGCDLPYEEFCDLAR
jgi:hypothetical protein